MTKKGKIIGTVVFVPLIVLCMVMIFLFSAQDGVNSQITSDKVTKVATEAVFSDYHSYSADNQTFIFEKMSVFIRKLAHFTEFALLGFLSFCFLSIYLKSGLLRMLYSVAFCGLYGASDELHQFLGGARTGSLFDVLIDTCGALLGVIIAFFIVTTISYYFEKKKKRGKSRK